MAKKGQLTGVAKGLGLSRRMSEVTELSFALKVKEERLFIQDGYKTWEDYCIDAFGCSADTMDRRLKNIKSFGREFTAIMLSLDMRPKQLSLVDHLLTEEQKADLKKGVLKIGDRTIPVTAENAMEIQSALNAAIKAEAKSEKTIASLEREHSKEVKALAAEAESLRAQLPPEDEEDALAWADGPIAEITRLYNEWEGALRRFAFHRKALDDDRLRAKVLALHQELQERLKAACEDFDRELAEGMDG